MDGGRQRHGPGKRDHRQGVRLDHQRQRGERHARYQVPVGHRREQAELDRRGQVRVPATGPARHRGQGQRRRRAADELHEGHRRSDLLQGFRGVQRLRPLPHQGEHAPEGLHAQEGQGYRVHDRGRARRGGHRVGL